MWSTIITYWIGKEKYIIVMARSGQSIPWVMEDAQEAIATIREFESVDKITVTFRKEK